MPKRTDLSDTFCPVGRSAELLGDRAVLLILRDLFFGRRRFEAIAVNTGLGPQLVSARLKLMEGEGVVERHAYQDRPPRYEYRLTAKGKDLFDVLYAMRVPRDVARAGRLRWVQLHMAGVNGLLDHPLFTQTAIPLTTSSGVHAAAATDAARRQG